MKEQDENVLIVGELSIMKFFRYGHLPPHLQEVSKAVGDLAREMVETLPPSIERTVGLRKLLEAKDCFVRARLGELMDNLSLNEETGERDALG